MASETTSDVFGNPVTLRLATPLPSGQLTLSVIGAKGNAWSQVFTYDQVSRVMDVDGDKLCSIVSNYSSKSGGALSVLIGISDIIVGCINAVAGVIKAILGSFVGFGLIGFFFVLMMLALSLMVSVYAFIFAAPLLAASYGLRYYKNTLANREAEKLRQAALALFEEAPSPVLTASAEAATAG